MQCASLTGNPFRDSSPSVKPFLISEGFRSAYCELIAAVHGGEGLAMLIGEPGIGKTTMLQHLLHGLRYDGIAVETYVSPVRRVSFGNTPGSEVGVKCLPLDHRTKTGLGSGRKLVLAVDGADMLPEGTLAEIVSQTGAPKHASSRVTVLLTGTRELASRPSVTERACRIAELRPLGSPEVAAYVGQLLASGQGPEGTSLPASALDALARYSRGNLSRINQILFVALSLWDNAGPVAMTEETISQAAIICDRSDPDNVDTQPVSAADADSMPHHAGASVVRRPRGAGAMSMDESWSAVRCQVRHQDVAATNDSTLMTGAGERRAEMRLRDPIRPSPSFLGYAAKAALMVTGVLLVWQILEDRFSLDLRATLHDFRTYGSGIIAYVGDVGAHAPDISAYVDDLRACILGLMAATADDRHRTDDPSGLATYTDLRTAS